MERSAVRPQPGASNQPPGTGRKPSAEPAHEAHVVATGVYLAVFTALLVLTAITVWAARHDFGPLNSVVALGIAVGKATLVILYFMHVKYSSRLTKLVVVSAFVFLGIMIMGTLQDYFSPHMTPGLHAPNLNRE